MGEKSKNVEGNALPKRFAREVACSLQGHDSRGYSKRIS